MRNPIHYGLLLICLSLSYIPGLRAQQWTSFQRYLETTSFESIDDIIAVPGGFAFVGRTDSTPEGSTDAILGRLDHNGELLWANTYGGTSFDYWTNIQASASGGYLLFGYTNSIGINGYDVWLSKADSLGNLLWSMTYGTADNDLPTDLIELQGGNLILGVRAFRPGNNDLDYEVLKIDHNTGNLIWGKVFGTTLNETLQDIKMMSGDQFVAFGDHDNGTDRDLFAVQMDTNGTFGWRRQYATSSDEYAKVIGIAPFSNEILLGGEIVGLNHDLLLISIDANGDLVQSKRFDSGDQDNLYDMRFKLLDGWYMAASFQGLGSSSYNFGMLHLNASLNYQWHNDYGNDGIDLPSCIVYNSSAQGYLLAGRGSSNPVYEPSIELVQIDPNGNSAGCNQQSGTMSATNGNVSVTNPPILFNVANPTVTAFLNVRKTPFPLRSSVACFTVDSPEPTLPSFKMHPNPAQNIFSVTLPNAAGGIVEMIDFSGKCIVRHELQAGESEILIASEGLPSGVYLVRVTQNDFATSRKMILQH